MKSKLLALLSSVLLLQSVYAQQIKVSYSRTTFEGPFTGKVFLYLSKDNKEPRNGDVVVGFSPCISIDVKNIKPGASVVFDDKANSYPVKLSEIERGEYYAQVVWDRNMGGRSIGQTPGNM